MILYRQLSNLGEHIGWQTFCLKLNNDYQQPTHNKCRTILLKLGVDQGRLSVSHKTRSSFK